MIATSKPRFPLLQRLWRVLRLTWSEFRGDRCMEKATGLAYVSLLGLFALVAVVLSISSLIFHDKGEAQMEDLVEKFIFDHIMPVEVTAKPLETLTTFEWENPLPLESAEEYEHYESEIETIEEEGLAGQGTSEVEMRQILSDSFSDLAAKFQGFRDNAIGVGAAGTIGLVLVSLMLFSQIERGFNDIYHVRRRRHMWTMLTSYFMILVLAPLGIGYSLALSFEYLNQFAWIQGSRVPSIVMISIIFTLGYWLVPNTRVPLQWAMLGGVGASVLWEAAKVCFIVYINAMPQMRSVLLQVGVIPIFLLWLFTTWMVVFFGLELCYVLQHYRPLAGRLLQRETPLDINPRHLLTVTYEMAKRFDTGTPQVTVQDLMRVTHLDENSVHALLDHCEERGWVMASVPHAIYHIARPPEQISLGEVLVNPLSQHGEAPELGGEETGLDAFWVRYHRSAESALPVKTLRDLLDQETRESGNEPAAP